MTEDKNFLREVFLGHQDVLTANLARARASMPHSSTKGEATELHWIKVLDRHLPNRYGVRKAQLLDRHGNRSEQIDLVIFDCQYTPLLLNDEGGCYIPVEGVYAVFEVKQEVSKEHIEYAGKKAASVRQLERTSASIPHAGGVYQPKLPAPIMAGLLTLGSSWSPSLGDSFRGALESLAPDQRLDLGCTVEGGAWRRENRQEGDREIIISQPRYAVMAFFIWLLSGLQKMGTAPAVDFDQYGKALGL